ncbi:PRD domain-containing protein [Haloimpatiens massiliensis]|uniref:PRD domain-containing protein n=1 Tax=Haloimpatiens massiliensis TaxID=1658110 RepID=UPI000C82EA82|nr:PRD domain-containing protein [Haloimpatiens massiliensis]
MFREKYRIIKSFNNNVVLCVNVKRKQECILIGKGVGFGAVPGNILKCSENIKKQFYLEDGSNKNNFINLTDRIDNNIVGVTEEIIADISYQISNKNLNEKIHTALLDHINFAIKRSNNNIEIKNPFLYEIKFLYKNEYSIALKALEAINKKLELKLPVDEAGFIAMHIHAAINNVEVSKATLYTTMINDMIIFIEEKMDKKIDKESVEYARLVTHLRFAIDRVKKKINIQNILLENIRNTYKRSYSIAEELSKKIYEEYDVAFPEGEIGYIAVHLENILK